MSEDLEQALLQAAWEEPADDTPWLVLADWLEERGDPRHELVRLQLSLRQDLTDSQRDQTERRVRALLESGMKPCVASVVNSIGLHLVLIRPGQFWMGSPQTEEDRYADEHPPHRVEITRGFCLGTFAVTQAQYQQVMGHNPSHFSATGHGAERVRHLDTGNLPVDSISWDDALAFCERLSRLPQERQMGRVYRLPTEAEWEYACRGGASEHAPFHFGYALSSHQANFDGGSPYGAAPVGPYLQRTTAVGSYPPNAFGLFDMHGNVWEWCADWFDVDYYEVSPAADPPGSLTGELRVLRGGSYFYIASSCRSAIRFGRRPQSRSNLDGFRVAVSLPDGRRNTG